MYDYYCFQYAVFQIREPIKLLAELDVLAVVSVICKV